MKPHLLFLLLFFSLVGQAQQIPFFGFYRDVAPFFNPAMTGFDHSFRANLLYRNQWTGLEGAPISYVGQVGTRLNSINSGVGLNVMHEEIGFSKYSVLTGNYNYQWSLSDGQSKFSLGVAPKLYISQSPNLVIDSSGVATPSSWNRSQRFSMNVGAAFQTEKLFVGLSAQNLIPAQDNYGGNLDYMDELNLSVMTSYDIRLTDKMILIPNIHVLSDLKLVTVFVNAKVEHEKLWWQLGYHNRSYHAAIGYRFLDRINVGYMLEFSSEAPIYPHVWSHEAFIAYELK